ncbi:MAG: hypothetical protein JNK98_09590 [Chitinophagaceae bacterium]|nr:hypothetical protein [Chitinophagaceae bacterium]
MHKQLRIISRRHLSACPFSLSIMPSLPSLPHWAFTRHIHRQPLYYRYFGTRVYAIGKSGWFVHCFPSGRRWLCCLPF